MPCTDRQIIALLDTEPENAMAFLIDTYSGLLWKVCREYVENEEDIKDCLNETFSEFYLHKERFDPEKGTLKGYLAAIARRMAIHCYQKERRQALFRTTRSEQEALDPTEEYLSRDELLEAMSKLDPVDEQILRMKYFQGLTAVQIAQSLGLPYETVKKRHQRSLEKLRKFLTIGMVIAVLLALLAACGYLVLRYFGLVPGYGVNFNADAATYLLEEPQIMQGDQYEIQLEDAYWQNDLLIADLKIYGGDLSAAQNGELEFFLEGIDAEPSSISYHIREKTAEYQSIRLTVQTALPEGIGESWEFVLHCDGAEIPISLHQASEETQLESAGFYSLTEEDGGLLAIPRLENGELVVSIYPLNCGDFNTYFFLNEGMWSEYGGERMPITATSEDGTVLTGEPAAYSPISEDSYLDWYFGPAEPGNYTLEIPYVYQYPVQTESAALEIPLTGSPEQSVELPGGSLSLNSLTPVSDTTTLLTDGVMFPPEMYPDFSWWKMDAVWQGENPERILAAAPVSVAFIEANDTAGTILRTEQTNAETGNVYSLFSGLLFGTSQKADSLTLEFPSNGLCYRWNHPFSIPMTVEPEPERQSFSQTGDCGGVSATPRRVNDRVILELKPLNTNPDAAISPDITRTSLPVDAVEEPIILTASDGTEYPGSYRPSRSGDASDWDFGDLPAGEYTLRIPYLYFTSTQDTRLSVPLPQASGEPLPDTLEAQTSFDSVISLKSVTGLGQMPEFPMVGMDENGNPIYDTRALAIAWEDGNLEHRNELPLQAQISLSFQSGNEEFTLLHTGLQLGKSLSSDAFFFQYEFGETGMKQTGLTLRYFSGIPRTELCFADQFYRWNHPLEISVTIPA